MDYEITGLTNLGHLKLLVQILEEYWAKKSTVEELEKKIDDIVNTGGEPNVIESIEVNGATLTVTDKTVDIFVPTNLSDLTNDENFQTESEVSYAIEQAIAKSGHASFKVVDAVPTVDEAEENVLYLVLNEKSECYDIYALIDGEIVLLDNTEVDLSDYVQKEEGKGLSSNDYTDEEKEKLSGIEDNANNYVHPTYTEQESGLYKITVDELGHTSEAVEVEKSDITDLGIPAQDTTYEDATQEESGLMSVDDKIKLDDLDICSDDDFWAMIDDVMGIGRVGTLEETDWSTISLLSKAGFGSNYWSVGDRKSVELNGTVGICELSDTYYAYILGFDHNADLEGANCIHFQFGFNEDNVHICFVDSEYNTEANSPGFRMNYVTNTNSGGWEASYMRNTICSEFKNLLPSDLQGVLNTVTKYTDNVGSRSDVEEAVTATEDDIFLLSEYEVSGTCTYANSYEQNYQMQYDYYLNGNSKIMRRHDNTSTSVGWFTRSANSTATTGFIYVTTSGAVGNTASFASRGFAPGFIV